MDPILVYLLIPSVIAVITTAYDKWAARHNRRRIAERTLFGMAIAGGAFAMYLTMYIIRHKTKHKRFMIGLPLITVGHIALWLWLTMGR